MSDAEFPALGFDPAVGNVASIREISGELTGTARYAGDAHDALQGIQENSGVWTGDAADQFADKVGELPGFLEDAHDSMTKAGTAMSTWADQLETHQQKARELEQRAEQALHQAEQADTEAQQATAKANTPIAYSADDPAAAQAANRQAQANADAAADANRASRAAWDNVEDIRRKAQDLRDRWEDDARVCREALDEAAERAPASGVFDAIGDFVSGAAEWLGDHLGDIAGIVSAIAGALAFIPVLTPFMGPIAIGAGALALGAHGTKMVVEGKWDEPGAWVELGGDALGLIPGIGAVSKGFNAAGDVVAGADKLVDVTRATGVAGMADTGGEAALRGTKAIADEMVQPSKAAQWAGDKLMGANPLIDTPEMTQMTTNVAKTLEGGTNVALQVPQGAGLADDSQQTTDAKNASTVTGAILNGITMKGR